VSFYVELRKLKFLINTFKTLKMFKDKKMEEESTTKKENESQVCL
jgi:hypothetical protein